MDGENTPVSKPNNGKLIAIIIAALLVVAAAVTAIVLILNGGGIKNIDDLKQAFKDKAAINCTLSKDDDSYTFQSTKDWDKIRVFGTMEEQEINMHLIKGDAIYSSADGMDFKIAYDGSYVDEFTNGIDEPTSEEDKAWSISCKPAGEANFEIPSKDWIDLSELQNSFESNDSTLTSEE